MSDLFELDLPARPESAIRHKVFFAVRPDADAAQQAHQLARTRRGLGGWITPPERLHVSLTHVASGPEIPSAVVARALDAAATIAARPFLLAFNRLATWGGKPGDRCVVLWGDEGVAGATGLQAALHRALTTAGVVRPAQAAFEPHLTLLRKQRDAPPEFIPPLRWWVREFLLIDSVHGEGRHEVLGRWTLGG
jgi:2'-5' RNA ligase